ncbi:MAG: hypothetical protein J0L81_08120 [Caulobacterales bacterium]|jgi:hypothetical protein|nr:hypothetical protein [Caulobacterales bacterium]
MHPRLFLATAAALALGACADIVSSAEVAPSHAHTGGIAAARSQSVLAPFDIVHAKISTDGNVAVFHMAVSGRAGETTPTPAGQFAGSEVFSYVWPTTIDPYEAGFERGAGILALAVTSHPDFDDTPLFDETRDGDRANDGGLWHMHWVVLGPDPACGEGALKVIDIPEGQRPRLPATWPGAPILLDSPGWQPLLDRDTVEVRVPFANIALVEQAGFDGVTAGLRVNASAHAPLLCVANVFDVASGDLSLPGRTNQ